MIEVETYIRKCLSGDIDEVTHTQILEQINVQAQAAEEFFKKEVAAALESAEFPGII